MQQKLQQLKLDTLGDLQQVEESLLIQHFGKYGRQLYLYGQGIDHRPVEANRQRQQISKEITFDRDLSLQECNSYWPILVEKVWQSLINKNLVACGISLKLRLKNFQTLQHSKSFRLPLRSVLEFAQAVELLLQEMHIDENSLFRLVGVGVYQLQQAQQENQLSLW